MRTFLAGYTLTVADMAIWGQLQGTYLLGIIARPSLHVVWSDAAVQGASTNDELLSLSCDGMS